MAENILNHCYRALDLLSEASVNLEQRGYVIRKLGKIDSDYQKEDIGYMEYEKRKGALLAGRSRKEWINFYNSYLLALVKKVAFFNHQVFYRMLCDNPLGGHLPPEEAMDQLAEAKPPSVSGHRKRIGQRLERRLSERKTATVQKKTAVAEKDLLVRKKTLLKRPSIQEKTTAKVKREEPPGKEAPKPQPAKAVKAGKEESFEELFDTMEG